MSGYIGTQPVPQATQHRETFTATASQTTFATVGYTPQFVDVYLNGIHLLDTVDYTATNSSDVVLTTGAAASDVVEIISYTPFEVANQTFTGTTTVDALTATGAFTSLGIDDNATSTAITIDASENVGIGTNAPAETLEVAGVVLAQDEFRAEVVNYSSNQDAPYMIAATTAYTGATTNWGTYGFQHKLKSDASGQVRITVDSYVKEAYSLDLHGNAIFAGDVTIGDDLFLTGPTPRILLVDNDIADEYTQLANAGGNTILGSRNGATNGQLIFRGEGGGVNTEYARFSAAGNFGIGNSTPAALLHVGSTDTVLGGTAGNDVNLLTLQADVSNSDLLQFTSERLTTGTSWTTAAHRIQRKVDASFMGYMQFGNKASDLITFGENATEYMRIDGGGNVGIGTSSPSAVLHSLSSGSSDTGVFERGDVSGTSRITIKSGDGSYGTINATDGGNTLAFYTGATEAMRVDSSGNLLVGKTGTATGTVGVQAKSNGGIYGTRNAGSALVINRLTSDGDIVTIMKDTVTVGRIGSNGSRPYFYGGSGIKMGLGGVQPCNSNGSGSDNDQDLGSATVRWDDVYATNGTIQTSDRNEKQQVAALTTAEITAAKAISAGFKTFKWNDSVAEKGAEARTHSGVIAQEVEQALTDAGLDAGDYAFFISNTWWETQTEVPAVEAVAEVLDAEGVVITEAVEAKEAYTHTENYDTLAEAPEGATERTRKGIRYPQLLAFVGAATEQRLASIETRLTALEATP